MRKNQFEPKFFHFQPMNKKIYRWIVQIQIVNRNVWEFSENSWKKNNFWCIFVIIHQTNAEKLTITCSSTFSSATSIFEWFDLILYTIWTNFQIKMMFHFSLQQENQPSAMKVLSILNPFVFVHLEWTKICFTIDFPFLYSN